MAQFLEFISIDPWQILFTWINLLILVWLLKKFLFKPVAAILAKRQAEVDQLYAEAENARSEAQADKAEYAEKLQGARDEAEQLLKAANERAARRSEELLADAQRQAARMKEKADEDIAQERLKAKAEVKNDVSEMVLEIAEKVIGRELNAADQNALIDRFIEEVDVGNE